MTVRDYIARIKRRFSGHTSSAEIPPDTIVYAVGDVHGRADLLTRLLDMIEQDVTETAYERRLLVFLGDYIDRGWQSREVLDILGSSLPTEFETVLLRGNHEEALLTFMEDPGFLETWRQFGGLETLHSYGLKDLNFKPDRDYAQRIHSEFLAAFPEPHKDILTRLPTYFELGGYFFAHAGVKPGVALDQQSEHDLCWIRDEFLNSRMNFGKRVVHGHCPEETPQVRQNRIGIDTGAYITGVLTAVVLEGSNVRFLQTAE